MSINQKSIFSIILVVNRNLDISKGKLDSKTAKVAREAFCELSNRELTDPSDQMRFIALASRLSVLSQKETTGIHTVVHSEGHPFDIAKSDAASLNSKDSVLARDFLEKAHLTEESAKLVDGILSKLPQERESILSISARLMKEGETIEQCILILQEVLEGKMKPLMLSMRILAQTNPHKIFSVIEENGITDQAVLIEIAKAVAETGGAGVPYYLKKCGITDQGTLIEIAKGAAAQNGRGVSAYIKNYGITDQAVLIEIAKIAAAQDGRGVSAYIKNYGITDQEALIEIAKIAAAQDGRGVSEYIKNYGITDQEALIEIAKIAAAQDGEGFSLHIKNYDIKNEGDLIEIVETISQQQPIELIYYLGKFDLDESTEGYKNLVLRGLLFGFATGRADIIKKITNLSCAAPFLFANEGDSATSEDKTASKKKPLTPFTVCIQVGAKLILPENLWSEVERNALLDKVAPYRNKPIAGSLVITLLEGGHLTGFKEAFLLLAGETPRKGKNEPVLKVHKILPSIIPAKWMALAKKDGTLAPEGERFVENLVSFLNSSRAEFRNNLSPALQTFLQTAIDLDKIEGLSPIKKLQILSAVCSAAEPMKELSFVRSLCSRKEDEALKTLPLENPVEHLKKAFEEALTRDQFIDLSNIKNLADTYLEKFENTRVPIALETYTTGIRTLGDERVRATLNRFVRSVLIDTFEIERYDAVKNPHLERIQRYDEGKSTQVLETWKTLTFTAPVTSTEGTLIEGTFSFEDFFKQKLGDRHGYKNEIDQFSELSSFLEVDVEKRESILTVLEQKITDAQAELKLAQTGNDKNAIGQRLKVDLAQKLCMELIVDPKLSKTEQIVKLRSISSGLPQEIELKNDVSKLAQNLETPQKSSSKEKVELSKDWEDLFLAGTEVAGSCQRVDGQAYLNKCLLAYCLDGKNAMVAVKGADGKLLARSMLRLLWDKGESKPVLFLDRLYPNPCPKEREEAIKMAACECSKKLGLELYTDWSSGSPSQGKIIESLGSSCPYEYADGAEGVMPNGVFTIRYAKKIEVSKGST